MVEVNDLKSSIAKKSRWVGIDPGQNVNSQKQLPRGYVGLRLCSPIVGALGGTGHCLLCAFSSLRVL